jgi:cytochrome c553
MSSVWMVSARAACLSVAAACLAVSVSADSPVAQTGAVKAGGFPGPADVDVYRKNIEQIFLRDRGGSMPGYASCVMCHTWQTRVRFTLQTPATDAGWTAEQSRSNFNVVTRLVNTADVETSRLLLKPLAPSAGGLGHTGGTYWQSKDDPEYQAVLKWIRSLPADRYVAAPGPPLDFEFFRACVQQVFAKPKEGHIMCSRCHGAGQMGFAPVPGEGRAAWNDKEAKQAYQVISRLIIPGNPEQSRFLLKPLHPDGGGSYAHNGVRRWQNREDPEFRMVADWVRGKRSGNNCS